MRLRIALCALLTMAPAGARPFATVERARDAVRTLIAADIEHRDFRFKPGSPALKLGIKPIDLKQVGPTPEFPKRLLRRF